MKSGGGDFSADAYEQLREAYDKEQQRQVDDEIKGTKLMGQEYGLETAPVDSPWADKIPNWTYPSGKGQYLDEHQSPDEILQVMRDAAQERLDADKDLDEDEDEVVSEVEAENLIEEILNDEDETEEGDEEDGDDEDEDGDKDDEVEEDEDEDEDEEVEEEDLDAQEIASQIADLRTEIEAMSFVTPIEETTDNDES